MHSFATATEFKYLQVISSWLVTKVPLIHTVIRQANRRITAEGRLIIGGNLPHSLYLVSQVFSFVMKMEGVSFPEALAMLGDPVAARELYRVLGDPRDPLVRDAAFRALATISAQTGQRLAAFGLDPH